MTGTFVFINMATDDVAAAREFYAKLGFKINETFSSDQNVFVIIADNVQLILGRKEFYKQLGEQREFIDTTISTEASVAISAHSREEVDEIYNKAIEAGGKSFGDPVEEKEIGLYARAFFDLDGHKIDINYMPS
jgi:predicted lactoylglutathione lyase